MKKFSTDQFFTALLGVLIMIASFFCAGVAFSIVDNCSLPQAVHEYTAGCILIALMAVIMYAYAIWESNQ